MCIVYCYWILIFNVFYLLLGICVYIVENVMSFLLFRNIEFKILMSIYYGIRIDRYSKRCFVILEYF